MKKDKLILQFQEAYKRLQEALLLPLSEPLVLDGTIQRFEFTFELSWKTLKAFLEDQGINCQSPKGCLQEAFKMGWLKNEEQWLTLMQARNMTSHVYNENMAVDIYETIREQSQAFGELLEVLKGY